MEINLIAEEMVTNVAKYSGLKATDILKLHLSCDDATLAIEVWDSGEPFDPLQNGHRSPLGAEIESAEIGGLGVHLVTQLSDRQSYHRNSGYNILRIEKDLGASDT